PESRGRQFLHPDEMSKQSSKIKQKRIKEAETIIMTPGWQDRAYEKCPAGIFSEGPESRGRQFLHPDEMSKQSSKIKQKRIKEAETIIATPGWRNW
ncbi:MAG: hypothetical protein WAW07_12460, partial [Bacteroidales bacterium]